jgi:tetratricopeptide (TPR) repeat protein
MRTLLAIVLLAACTTIPTPPKPEMSPETRAKRVRELADAIVWHGRRTAYLGNYQEAIDLFTDGAKRFPDDARMLRHRGHRWITLRQFDRAVADLTKAASLIRGKPDEIEPDGLPNARNIPTSTLQSNIWYHLGLAHYLRGDFEQALDAYRECMKVSKNPDGVVSTSHWLYMTLRRLNRRDEAERVLDAISTDMDVIENQAYHKLLLMYRGEIVPEEMEADATTQYGVGNWYLYNGQPERARPVFQRIVSGKEWSAFGYIAAETDLHRLH